MSSKWAKTNVSNLLRNTDSGRYYARIKVSGRQVWRSLDTAALSVAKLRLPDLEKEVRSVSAPVRSTEKTSFRYWLLRLREKMEAENIKPSTLLRYRIAERALVATWPNLEYADVRRITEIDCKEWSKRAVSEGTGLKSPRAKEAKGTMSASALNKCIDVLRHALDLAREGGLIYKNPASSVNRLPVPAKRLELPSREKFYELAKEIGRAGARQSKGAEFLVRFLATSGMRLAEAGAVKWDDVDLERGMLMVRGTKTKTAQRDIPIFPALKSLLVAVPVDKMLGDVCKIKSCEEALTHACEKIGIKRITHHDLRHLFATTCIESGVDIPTVSRWLGHSDGGALAMRTYGHLRSEHSEQMAKLVRL
jgi:integrase